MKRSKLIALLLRDFAGAGDLYLQEGKIAKAARLYARAGRHAEAGRIAAEAGLEEEALAYFLEAGEPLKAGDMLASWGRHKEAIPLFEQAGAHWQAAESSLQLQQPARAARHFERANYGARAADCYEKAGELEQALRLWEAEAKKSSASAGSSDPGRRRNIDLRRTRIYARIGEFEKAAQLLRGLGEHEKAAQMMERAGRLDGAAGDYLEANQPERAREMLDRTVDVPLSTKAKILAQSGDLAGAAELYARLGRDAEAAELFEAIGAWAEAGAAWERADELGQAAESFFKAEAYPDAARCYLGTKDYRAAAEAFLRASDFTQAAHCQLRLGQPVEAARSLLDAGDRATASRVLQKIEKDDEDFERATLMLVPLLLEERLYEGALHRLELLDPEGSTGEAAVERLYWEGRTYDAANDLVRAERAYQRALALRRDHRDLTARLISLRQRMTQAGIDPVTTITEQRVAPVASIESGTVLDDRYELLDELGRGGMSRVFRARDSELGARIAIKILLRQSDRLRSEQRLQQEVQICRQISHPNVVRVFDIGRWQGYLYVTMELLEGTTLDKVIRSGQRVDMEVARQLLRDILLGLEAAHELRVIHRDLKPANVALSEGRAKIMDFGIAVVEDADVSLTQTGQVVGSPMYMSPEQIQGLDLDARTDLYSFGVLLFSLLTGYEPFRGKTATAISLKHLQERPPSLREARPDVDAAWETMVFRLLAKKPEDRYPSARAVREVLETLPI